MICDNIKNLDLYRQLHPGFARAFDWLATLDPASLPDGKTVIDGKHLWVSVSRGPTRPVDEGLWEAHRQYIDIQYVVQGHERIDWADLAGARPGTYNADKDFLPLDSRVNASLYLGPGQFAIFFPQDAHMPGLCLGKPEPVCKIVVKVAVDANCP